MAKVANNQNDLVKGSLTRQKLQNSKVYAKSQEFSPSLGLTRKMVPIKGQAKVKLFDVHALCHFDVRKESFS